MKTEVSEFYQDLTLWFTKHSPKEVISYELIAKRIKDLRGYGNVTLMDVGSAVSICRIEMELRHETTIVNVRGSGYKIANPDELALATAKWMKRSIMYADRTYRLVDIVDRRKIPGAIKQVFLDNEGRIKTLSKRGQQFVGTFMDYLKEETKRKEIEDATNSTKSIRTKNGKKNNN